MPGKPQRRKSRDYKSIDELIKHIQEVQIKSTEIISKMRALQKRLNAVSEKRETRENNRRK